MRPSLVLVALVTVSLLALSVSAQDSTEKTKMIIEVIRHGARVPVYPVGSADWMKGLQSGDLTNLGLRQHYLLGKELAKRYPEFFGEKLAFDEFYVRSSGYQRTVNSAIAHLMGIWNHFDPSQLDFADNDIRVLPAAVTMSTTTSFRTPLPKGYLPDAIHTEDQDQEMLLAPLQSRVCPKMNQLSQKMTDEISKEMDGKSEFRSKVEEAAKKYGVTIKSGKSYADYCREMGDFAIQDVRNNPDPVIKPTDDLYKVLLRCSEGHMMIRYTDVAMKKVVVAELVKEITTKLKAKAEDKGSLRQKYHLYSGHDVTILPLLALVDAADAACYINDFKQTKYTPECKGFPDTASNLVFELLSTGSRSEE